MNKQVIIAISSTLAVVVLFIAGLLFFWKNPFRVGELTLSTPKGPSVTFKVANSNEISELIQKGLEDKRTAGLLTNNLLDIIERLPPGSKLGEKLIELVERRQPPFSSNSVSVKRLVYDPNVPRGLASACESSGLLAKNIVVFVLNSNGEMLGNFPAYVDGRLAFPCPDGGETLRINSMEVEEFSRHTVLAKRTF